MLKSIRLRNFKSFHHEDIPLARLTLLVGANASGKSNLLDALRLLQGVGQGMSLVDVLRGSLDGRRLVRPGLRGGIAEVARSGTRRFGLETSWEMDGHALTHCLAVDVSGPPQIVQESLVGGGLGAYLFDTHAPTLGATTGLGEGGALNVGLKGTGGGRNPRATFSSARSVLGQVRAQPRVHELVMRWSQRMAAALSSSIFLDISPRQMRDYAPINAPELGAQGENISAVLYALCQDEDRKQDLIDWLSELCSPTLQDIGFVKTDLDDVMLKLVEEGGAGISARSLSDGTLRFLGELAALLTASPGSLVLIEELENGLHPARVHLLIDLLTSVTQERGIQVIATTHSPRALHALADASPELLQDAVVFGRVPGQPGSLARRLGSLPAFEDVLSRRGIEYLFTTQWLERAL